MKTRVIEFDVSEIMESPNETYFKHYKDSKEFPDDGRHNDLCTVCGFPSYPECRKWCNNDKLLNNQKES